MEVLNLLKAQIGSNQPTCSLFTQLVKLAHIMKTEVKRKRGDGRRKGCGTLQIWTNEESVIIQTDIVQCWRKRSCLYLSCRHLGTVQRQSVTFLEQYEAPAQDLALVR